jgi:hypothetical protein
MKNVINKKISKLKNYIKLICILKSIFKAGHSRPGQLSGLGIATHVDFEITINLYFCFSIVPRLKSFKDMLLHCLKFYSLKFHDVLSLRYHVDTCRQSIQPIPFGTFGVRL